MQHTNLNLNHYHYEGSSLSLPSKSMPADLPSRGVRRRPVVRKAQQPHRASRLEKFYLSRDRAWDRLAETGMVDSDSTSE